ncbi:MAG: VOC family protein, partial [Verrucomicrobiota bacterium]
MIKFLHTRIRVSDLEQSMAFYSKLGFECTR